MLDLIKPHSLLQMVMFDFEAEITGGLVMLFHSAEKARKNRKPGYIVPTFLAG